MHFRRKNDIKRILRALNSEDLQRRVIQNDTEVLVCANEICSGKLLGRVSHFVSKKGMDIEGPSEATLEKFINLGWIKKLFDVYNLGYRYAELRKMEGFGDRSVHKLQENVEKSKDVELKNFIAALSIPGIGTSQSKEMAKNFSSWEEFQDAGSGNYDFFKLEGFGEVLNHNIHHWFNNMWDIDRIGQLVRNLRIRTVTTENKKSTAKLEGETFAITGTVEQFANRKELQEFIEARGGKVTSSVTAKTSCMINNDVTSNSSKNRKAKELGIPIITEEQFLVMAES